jgi:hypothetical protein
MSKECAYCRATEDDVDLVWNASLATWLCLECNIETISSLFDLPAEIES